MNLAICLRNTGDWKPRPRIIVSQILDFKTVAGITDAIVTHDIYLVAPPKPSQSNPQFESMSSKCLQFILVSYLKPSPPTICAIAVYFILVLESVLRAFSQYPPIPVSDILPEDIPLDGSHSRE